jgi:hypothetical protein
VAALPDIYLFFTIANKIGISEQDAADILSDYSSIIINYITSLEGERGKNIHTKSSKNVHNSAIYVTLF